MPCFDSPEVSANPDADLPMRDGVAHGKAFELQRTELVRPRSFALSSIIRLLHLVVAVAVARRCRCAALSSMRQHESLPSGEIQVHADVAVAAVS